MGTPCVSWTNEPERKSPPEVPGWLQDELHGNVVFVAEAVEHRCPHIAPEDVAGVAQAYVDGITGPHTHNAYFATEMWIADCWETEEYNANAMSRKWARAAEGKV